VSDILTLPANLLQPIPVVEVSSCAAYADGIITHDGKMICFLNLERMLEAGERQIAIAA